MSSLVLVQVHALTNGLRQYIQANATEMTKIGHINPFLFTVKFSDKSIQLFFQESQKSTYIAHLIVLVASTIMSGA